MPEIKKFRKKPVVIKAYQTDMEIDILTPEGTMHASVGDWIITGVNGEQYPCKPDIFEKTYEPANEQIDSGCSGQETVDCIKRSDALKLICSVCQHLCDDSDEFGNGICSIFTSLEGYPAADVEPKRKTGWWVGMKEYCQHLFDTTGERYTMSQLGISLPHCNQCWEENESRTPFCPHCGAKMLHEPPKGEDDEGC